METRSKDACQTAAADSTTAISVLSASQNSENCSANSIGIQQPQQQQQRQQTGVINAPPPPPPQQQQQVSSTSSAPKTNSPTPTNSGPNNNNSNSNNNNNNATNKTKSQQQQQQYHQFRAPQQFVRHRRATIPVTLVNKKGKTWNKRQQRGAKQLQQQLQQQMLQSGNAVIGVGDGISVATGASATSKADLENIQNFKNQLGGHHYYQHGGGGGGGVGAGAGGGHRGIVGVNPTGGGSGAGGTGAGASGNGLPPAALANLEKLGYGHGHVKMHKKLLVHRGPGNHHHHVLCAGSAHNTIGGNANSNCCLVNGCNGGGGGHPNGKDTANGSTNSSQSGNTANSLHYCCSRSKFFLPDKRTRKEVIIPPTKFLLGGNISDPLNLNSLQNENSNASSNSNTPATTPRQSPITTPPKVEVIIPPNIHDPLHLLDPVDSMEYEKQLTSPMKRSGQRGGHAHHHSAKHRHRKNRKSKRRRHDSYQSSVGSASIGDSDMSALANSTLTTDAGSINLTSLSLSTTLSVASLLDSSANSSGTVGDGVKSNLNTISSEAQLVSTCENAPAEYRQQLEEREESKSLDSAAVDMACVAEERLGQRNSKSTSPIKQFANVVNSTFSGASLGAGEAVPSSGVGVLAASMAAVATTGSVVTGAVCGSAGGAEALASASAGGLFLPRERANRDLRLELNATTLSSLSGSTCGSGIGIGGGRKRKISESNNSQKNKKFHRDAMDKIVSPVVPQPGAWKRPPRLAATGARKPTRRSTSISETDVLSPADEVAKPLMNEADLLRVETPDFSKLETISEVGLASPLSTTSGATSVAAGEQESPMDTSAGDTSATMPTDECPAAGDAAKSVADVPTNQPTSIAQLTKMPHFRADGVKYQYGNYDRYVGLRHLNELVDVRLQVFQRHLELFKNKDILDIGCNVGHMTITVARNFAPKSILGIDIDRKLVARARHNLALYVRIPTEPAVKALDASASIKKEEEKGEIRNDKVAASSAAGEIKTETVCTKDTANSAGDKMGPAADASVNKPKKTRRRKKSKHPTQQFGQQQQQQHAQHQLQQQQQQHHHHHHHHHHMHHHHHNHYHYQQQQQALHVPATDLFPVSFPLTYGVIPTGKATASHATADAHSPSASINTPGHASNATPASGSGGAANRKRKNEFPRNVFFRHQNYVLEDEAQLANDTQQYDLILCLSVTKWIHLNFGDAGLKMTFKRMFNQLRPGGKLILEAQNWASYKKKKNLTPRIYHNYRNIEFFPNKFHEYLLSSEVGFSHSYTLGVPRHLSKGFCRPIQLYAKGDYTPNHIRWSDAYYPQTPFEAYRGIYATMPPRPAGLASYAMSSTRSQAYDTPHYTGGTSGPYSCHQTPQPIYNPLETDSYLPSYDIGYLNHMYVFASPLYQTIWSPPASLRNSSSHTPVFGSVREAELDGDGGGSGGGGSYHRHVYPPNEDTSSPNANAGGAFSSIRDADTDDSNQLPAGGMQHVYATNCGESSSSPQVQHNNDSDALVEDALLLDDEQHVGQGQGQAVVAGGGTVANVTGTGNGELHVASGAVGQEGGQHYCDLNDA